MNPPPPVPGTAAYGGYNTPIDIDATRAGFANIGQYLQNAPQLIQEQRRTQQFIKDFRNTMKQIAAEQRQLDQQYAQMEKKTEDALNRMLLAGDKNGPPSASQRPVAQEQTPNPVAGPTQLPNLSGFNFPSQAQAEPEPASAPDNYPTASAKPAISEALPALENNLEAGRRDGEEVEARQSRIATKENTPGDDDKGGVQAAGLKVLPGQGGKNAKAKPSLRDKLKAALANSKKYGAGAGGEESGSQSATRALLEEAQKTGEGRELASAGAGNGSAGASGGSGGAGFSTAGFGQPDLNNGAVRLNDEGAQAQAARLSNELAEKAAPEVLGKESPGLFERVRFAHERSQKNGRLAKR